MTKPFRFKPHMLASMLTLLVLCHPIKGQTATAYVGSETPVILRATPSNESPVIYSGLNKGTEVNVLEVSEDKQSCLVKLSDGTKGWMSTLALRKTAIEAMPASNSSQNMTNETRTNNLSYADLLKQHGTLQKNYEDAVSEIERLKELNNENMRLEKNNDVLNKQNQQIQNETKKISDDMNTLKKDRFNTGLLYGALIFLVGYLIGYTMKARTTRRSLW